MCPDTGSDLEGSTCDIDESLNSLGPNRCNSDSECHGERTCSQDSWCTGDSLCPDPVDESDLEETTLEEALATSDYPPVAVQTMSFGNEFSWEITNVDSSPTVVCSGGPYDSNTLIEVPDC